MVGDTTGGAMSSLIRTPLLLRPSPTCVTRNAAFDRPLLLLTLVLPLILLLPLPPSEPCRWIPAPVEEKDTQPPPPPPKLLTGASVVSPEDVGTLQCSPAGTLPSLTILLMPLLVWLRLLLMLQLLL